MRPKSKGLGRAVRKAWEVNLMICPRCGERIKVVAFLTECAIVDQVLRHLGLTLVAWTPLPAHVFEEVALMAAEQGKGVRITADVDRGRSLVMRGRFLESPAQNMAVGSLRLSAF